MAQGDKNCMRIFTASRDDSPIGIVALNNVDRVFRTGTLWGAAGDKSLRNWGYGTLAGSKMLTLAFRELRLLTVNTWVVDRNPSLRTVERMGFRYAGRQRQCHFIDGRAYDRLLFDVLASEHRELDDPLLARETRKRRDGHQSAVVAVTLPETAGCAPS